MCPVRGCAEPASIVTAPLCLPHAIGIYERVHAHLQAQGQAHQEEQDRRARASRPKAAPRSGSVYYLLVDGFIKIGHATHVWERMRAYPPSSVLLAVEPGTTALERERHSRFAVHLAHGREWFRPNPELDAHIEDVRRRHPHEPAPLGKERTRTTKQGPRPRTWVRGV